MRLFKSAKRATIQVLKVSEETRDVVEEDVYYSQYHTSNSKKTKTTKKVKFTIVLLVKDGELMTREFNGKWSLADIRKWEEV